ncbi:MAG: BatA domain-containing protein [Nitratireductor sp.]|nr:BatA domain-containing protein [Nitratireductor sp.]
MFGLPLAFASPMILGALVLLPVIWWLLRLTPPRPQSELFPPLAILARLVRKEETPAKSPWWLTLLRLLMAALVIFAMAGPVLNPQAARLAGEGPVAIVIDNGWASAPDWEERRDAALSLVGEAEAANRTVAFVETAGADVSAMEPMDAATARARLAGMEPKPLKPDHAAAAGALSRVIAQTQPGSVFLLSDGLSRAGTDALAGAMAGAQGQRSVIAARTDRLRTRHGPQRPRRHDGNGAADGIAAGIVGHGRGLRHQGPAARPQDRNLRSGRGQRAVPTGRAG